MNDVCQKKVSCFLLCPSSAYGGTYNCLGSSVGLMRAHARRVVFVQCLFLISYSRRCRRFGPLLDLVVGGKRGKEENAELADGME